MGGNAFPIPAKRLSTPQLLLLKTHSITSLSPFFTRVSPLRDARVKADHGDLDLICGWDHEKAWNWKGEERGWMGSGDGMGGNMGLVREEEVQAGLISDELQEEEEGKREKREKLDLSAWCFDLGRAVQAKEWVRRGPEISFAIPCSVFGEGSAEHKQDKEAFYQLDIPLIPPASLDFYLISVSYSTTFLILARAVRCISPSLTLQMTGLIIRHAAYSGIPGIDLRLTSSADELCAYLGLKRERWEEGFDTEQDCWTWLADVESGGKLEEAYKRIVKPRAVKQKGHKSKAGGLDGFVSFLRTTKWGEGWDKGMEEVRAGTPVLAEEEGKVPPLTPSSGTTISTFGPITPATTISSLGDIIDPDHPLPLDSRAQAALDKWGKKEAYEAILKERKEEAVILAQRQRKRVEGRAKAQEAQRRKEEEEDLEGRMVPKLADLSV